MLTLENQYQIDDLLRQENLLTNEDLIAELTDHCSVSLEDRLAQGMNAETALVAINADFGGRSGLQKLERQYNRVTFRRYDALWWETMKNLPFQPKRLAFLLALWGFTAYSFWPSHQHSEFAEFGFFFGLLLGTLFTLQVPLWDYLKKLVRQGWHNPPTEVQYILRRTSVVTGVLGIQMAVLLWFGPILSDGVNAAIYVTYFTLFWTGVGSLAEMHKLLYKTDDFSWD
jgi:hypothetical protein